MTLTQLILKLKKALIDKGEKLTPGNSEFGLATEAALSKYDVEIVLTKKPEPPKPTIPEGQAHAENPAYKEAKKYEGKGESNSVFVAWLSKFWGKTGLPQFKTIVGSSFAWCALFIVAMNSEVGQKYVGSAMARDQSKYGVEISYKENGIPRGAVIHLNNNGDCSSWSSNHVTFADGDCSVADVNKAGAMFPGLGGNQANMVKRSMYAVSKICAVRWPTEVPKPGKITKSVSCSGVDQGKESTQ